MEAYSVGTLAGAGSFRCETCGYAIALHEQDEVPACPHCSGDRFKRSSIFMDHGPRTAELEQVLEVESPDWIDEARTALIEPGPYLAFEGEARAHVVPLQEGWTRVGRSMSAHVRFDDPTVSRRHALIHRDRTGVRILDDRSLNGIFLNGRKVDWSELEDGDEIAIGAFRLYFMQVTRVASAQSQL